MCNKLIQGGCYVTTSDKEVALTLNSTSRLFSLQENHCKMKVKILAMTTASNFKLNLTLMQ